MPGDRWRRLWLRRRTLRAGVVGAADSVQDQVHVVAASPLFDDRWYSLLLRALGPSFGAPLTRQEAARHYLTVGRREGITPHPLFDPVWCASGLDLTDDERDPLVAYLEDRRYDVSTHPLFDVEHYLRDEPEGAHHPHGPVGHYLAEGARRGAHVNDWYRPDLATEPRGLVDRLWRDAEDWVVRQCLGRTDVAPRTSVTARLAGAAADGLTTTVVLVSLHAGQNLVPVLESVRAQDAPWELVILGVGHAPQLPREITSDDRVHVVTEPQHDVWQARNRGLALARGTHVAFLSVLEDWAPGRLRACHDALAASGAGWFHDRARGGAREFAGPFVRERLRAGVVPPLGSVVIARELAAAVGGFDEELPAGRALDFLLRVAEYGDPAYADRIGVTIAREGGREGVRPASQRSLINWDRLGAAPEVALNRHLIDWSAVGAAEEPGTAVVVVASDGPATAEVVSAILADEGGPDEVTVVDNGTDVVSTSVLAALSERFDRVSLVRTARRFGLGLATNLGVAATSRSRIALLRGDAKVHSGWRAPLEAALDDAEVLGAQALLLDAAGTIDTAGIVFPRGGGMPYALLRGFPVEDAVGIGDERLHAVSGAALALRRADLVAVQGLDPLYRHGFEDIDLCLRLAGLRPGHFVVRPDSVVCLGGTGRPDPMSRPAVNRRIFYSRWPGRLPEDDAEVWRRRGLAVVGHRMAEALDDRRLVSPEPMLVRATETVVEGIPRLRWAIKNPAPGGPEGELWGDTWFARHLAEALRDLGQDVVIDHRPAHFRSSEYLDDVVLLLRGTRPYTPLPGRVNLMWLISNPDKLGRPDPLGWDRVYVASVPFARRLADQWGAPAVPLLQATDPNRFHPDLAEPDTGPRMLFVGNRRPEPRVLLKAAVDVHAPLTVYGSGWEGEVPAEMLGGTFLPNEQLGAAYRAAGMVLNDHWRDMAAEGFIANRLFDSVAAGARVVSDDVPGIAEVFGEAVHVVRQAEELSTLAAAPDLDAVFGSDEERRARAAQVAAEHSFTARARTILEDALRIRSERGLGE